MTWGASGTGWPRIGSHVRPTQGLKGTPKKNEICPAGCHHPEAAPWPKPGWQRRLSLACLPRRVRELLRTSRNSPLPPLHDPTCRGLRGFRLALTSFLLGFQVSLQQTGPSARLGHTPPGFTGQAAPDWIGDREWIGDTRANARKSCDLRSNKFRESSPVLGKQAQNFCASMQSYFSQTYRFRTTEPTQIALSTVVAC